MGELFFDLTFGLFEKLQDFTEACRAFLFEEINVLGITFSAWQFLSGTALVVLFVALIIKKVVPAA